MFGPISAALLEGNETKANELLRSTPPDTTRTLLERWQIKVLSEPEPIIEGFEELPPDEQKSVYQTANCLQRIEWVACLNQLPLFRRSHSVQGPTVLSNSMDVATIRDVLKATTDRWRKEGKLLLQQEFSLTPNWIRKGGDISRLLGQEYLLKKINELGLKYIKVPQKVAVILGREPSQLKCRVDGSVTTRDLIPQLWIDHILVYAERITCSVRNISREEYEELVLLIEEAHFTDIHDFNFVVAQDGIYFIDTERKSFTGDLDWKKAKPDLHRLVGINKPWFDDDIQKRMNKPEQEGELSYVKAANYLERISGVPEEDLRPRVKEGAIKASQVVQAYKLCGAHKTKHYTIPLDTI